MQSIQCGGSSFLPRYFSILYCLISFLCLSFQARLPATQYLMGGRTLGLYTVGRGGIAPRITSPAHHDLTFSSAQYLSAFIYTCLSSGTAHGSVSLSRPFIPTIVPWNSTLSLLGEKWDFNFRQSYLLQLCYFLKCRCLFTCKGARSWHFSI